MMVLFAMYLALTEPALSRPFCTVKGVVKMDGHPVHSIVKYELRDALSDSFLDLSSVDSGEDGEYRFSGACGATAEITVYVDGGLSLMIGGVEIKNSIEDIGAIEVSPKPADSSVNVEVVGVGVWLDSMGEDYVVGRLYRSDKVEIVVGDIVVSVDGRENAHVLCAI
jgi:hypothetical protein